MANIYDKSSLVLIPSGTKTGKVFSQKPVSGDGDFTFTRASAATRVNADGNIEKETENKILQSNTFDTTWLLNTTSATSGQSGYDGTNDAWLLNSTGTGFPRIQQSVSTSGVFVFSVYAKPATDGFMLIRTFGADSQVWFDLSDGSISNEAGAQYISSSTEDVGNGWYRYSVLVNGSLTSVRIYPASAYGVYSTSGNGIYIQDAQINQGLVAQPYQETTTAAVYGGITDNTPRLDYTDSSCPALLLEPLRTNLIEQSEYFGAWSAFGGAVLTHNDAVSPEGISNAVKFSNNGVFKQYATAANTDYVFSVFAKTDTATAIAINYVDQTAPYRGGTITYTFATDSVAVTLQSENNSVTADREDYGNGWIRVIMKFKTDVNKNYNYQQIAFSGGSGWVYGAQLEAGSYATSYIPTYGSSVSRVADACLGAGDASTFNSTEGVLFWEGSFDSTSTTAGAIAIIGSGVNRVQLYNSGASLIVLIQVDGVMVFNKSTSGTIDITSNHKYAVKWGLNDFAFWIDGVEYSTDTSGATFSNNTLNELRFSDIGASYLYANTKQVLTFNTSLSNEELAALTTI